MESNENTCLKSETRISLKSRNGTANNNASVLEKSHKVRIDRRMRTSTHVQLPTAITMLVTMPAEHSTVGN